MFLVLKLFDQLIIFNTHFKSRFDVKLVKFCQNCIYFGQISKILFQIYANEF